MDQIRSLCKYHSKSNIKDLKLSRLGLITIIPSATARPVSTQTLLFDGRTFVPLGLDLFVHIFHLLDGQMMI